MTFIGTRAWLDCFIGISVWVLRRIHVNVYRLRRYVPDHADEAGEDDGGEGSMEMPPAPSCFSCSRIHQSVPGGPSK
jgi:hypothetical protein